MLTLLLAMGLQAYPATPTTNCTKPHELALDVRPVGWGPLRIKALHCHQGAVTGHGRFDPLMSPDGRQLAIMFEYDPQGLIRLLPVTNGDQAAQYDTGIGTFMRFAGYDGDPVLQWSSNSRFVWTAHQTRMRPRGGWALTPLKPVRVALNGTPTNLPTLSHPAGPLDGLLWAGSEGRAFAQFGTRGSYYRPERANPEPTLAIVDASHGKVLESISLSKLATIAGLEPTKGSSHSIQRAAAVQLPDGRVRALLFVVKRWILWTQGEPPLRLTRLPAIAPPAKMAFDGKRLLVMRPASPEHDNVVVFSCGPPRHGPCPPRDARAGAWAALYDVRDGKTLWTLRRTFDARDRMQAPAISSDGRYALVGLEPDGQGQRRAALLSMRDGRVAQTLPAPANDYALGFTKKGKLAWLQAHTHTAIYDVK